MTDSHVLNDLNDSPENSSASRSWTRQHGGKHREFSASRLQARERARMRVQRAIQEERERARMQTENRRAAAPASIIASPEDSQLATQAVREEPVAIAAPAAEPRQEFLKPQSQTESANAALAIEPNPRAAEETAPVEDVPRPAWLSPHRLEITGFAVPPAPADTLQGARDRLASRWFALKGMFEGAAAAEAQNPAPASLTSPAPILTVFSLAGGVGKSSLAATLARTLSARGERVLLVETAVYGLLPCFFGARDRRPGVLRTFAAPESGSDAPVQMISLDAELTAADANSPDPLAAEIARYAQNAGRVIVDIATASTTVARRLLRMSPLLLVPLAPDMNSVVNAGFIDSVFHRSGEGRSNSSEVYYVLNQFDPSLPLHLDVREVLRERLGSRLLPFTLRNAPAVSEALAEGMTVVDYAPLSPVAEDFDSLASWIRARYAPAGASARGMRWIEK